MAKVSVCGEKYSISYDIGSKGFNVIKSEFLLVFYVKNISLFINKLCEFHCLKLFPTGTSTNPVTLFIYLSLPIFIKTLLFYFSSLALSFPRNPVGISITSNKDIPGNALQVV